MQYYPAVKTLVSLNTHSSWSMRCQETQNKAHPAHKCICSLGSSIHKFVYVDVQFTFDLSLSHNTYMPHKSNLKEFDNIDSHSSLNPRTSSHTVFPFQCSTYLEFSRKMKSKQNTISALRPDGPLILLLTEAIPHYCCLLRLSHIHRLRQLYLPISSRWEDFKVLRVRPLRTHLPAIPRPQPSCPLAVGGRDLKRLRKQRQRSVSQA